MTITATIEQVLIDELRVGDRVAATDYRLGSDGDPGEDAPRISTIDRGPRHASVTFEDGQVITGHYLDTWLVIR